MKNHSSPPFLHRLMSSRVKRKGSLECGAGFLMRGNSVSHLHPEHLFVFSHFIDSEISKCSPKVQSDLKVSQSGAIM